MATKFYKCAHCGNVIVKVVDSGVPVVCCGKKMEELVPNYKAMGFEYGETNPELVTNTKVQSMWEFYKPEIHKRRATFKKSI